MADLGVIVCIAFDHRASAEGLARFKDCIFRCPFVDSALEVSGTFDLIVHARLSSLEEYTNEMERIAPQLAEYASRVESNFVGRKVERTAREYVLWVPCREGRRRIDAGMINKIIAEGDYMRLCMDGSECLVHDTIRHLLGQLDREQFIQLHRSAVVRVDYIDRLMHRERRWIARLRDGSEQIVAKSRVSDILRTLSVESSKVNAGSPAARGMNESAAPLNETVMKVSP